MFDNTHKFYGEKRIIDINKNGCLVNCMCLKANNTDLCMQ